MEREIRFFEEGECRRQGNRCVEILGVILTTLLPRREVGELFLQTQN